MWVKNDRINSQEGYSRGTWLRLNRTREWCDDNAPCLCLPVRVNDRTLTSSDGLVVPVPGLGVDRLADRTDDPQRAQVMRFYVLRAVTTQEANRRGRRIELRQLALLDHLPIPRRRRVNGGRFEYRCGGAVCQWAINDVTAEECEKKTRLIKKGETGVTPKTYECPVIQPTSARQAYLSSGWISKTYLCVRATPSRYPAVVCTTPLGFPVEPDVCKGFRSVPTSMY